MSVCASVRICVWVSMASHNQQAFPDLDDLWKRREFSILEELILKHHSKHSDSIFLNGRVPLVCLACRDGPLSLVNALLATNANFVMNDKDGRKPLHYACEGGRLDVVSALLLRKNNNQFNVNVRDKRGRTPLHLAFMNGHKDVATFLLSQGADPKVQDDDLSTLLHFACWNSRSWWHQNVDLVERIVAKGAEIDTPDDDGYTPLNFACRIGHLEAMAWLLDRGANANHVDSDGETPVWRLSECFHRWWCDQKSAIELLVSKGADIDHPNPEGATPLYHACELGKAELVELLLTRGANATRAANCGSTPFHVACLNGHAPVVKLLLPQIVDANAPIKCGRTPLHLACSQPLADVVELLLAHGALMNARDHLNMTPLDVACKSGHVNVVRHLLSHDNAHANALTTFSATSFDYALHSSAISDDTRINLVATLLSFGINPPSVGDVPFPHAHPISWMTSNFQMVILHQMLHLCIDGGRALLKKPTVNSLRRSALGQWGLYKLVKNIIHGGFSWDLQWLILKKACSGLSVGV